ncbi:hypothetical protein A1D22_09145 [Pasteurellaceae bacterium LFhippo2]|nr:hypothetical protein [Pasteurellaceae bacterium LFhippo2]
MTTKIIHLEDKGQDVLRLLLDKNDNVLDIEPCNYTLWKGYHFSPKNRIGKKAILTHNEEHTTYIEEKEITLLYKVVSIEEK